MPDATPLAAAAEVRSLFGRIADRYDLANRILSAGQDRGWRRRVVRAVRRAGARDILDLATGSGDLALALAQDMPEARVLGLDFCEPMLARARAKQASRSCANVSFALGDALALDLPSGSFDAVTIAFGLRNLQDRARGLAEMRRVLRPGGRLLVLEFSQAATAFRPIYLPYLRHVLPRLGGWITGDRAAYAYLNETIERFPGREDLSREMLASGFAAAPSIPLAFGAVALHEAVN